MDQKDIKRVSTALMTLEVAVRHISDQDIDELLKLKDSGRGVAAADTLPEFLFEEPRDAVTVLWALRDFKKAVGAVKSYQAD